MEDGVQDALWPFQVHGYAFWPSKRSCHLTIVH